MIDLKLLPDDVEIRAFLMDHPAGWHVSLVRGGRVVHRKADTPEAAYRAALEAWEEKKG